MFKPKLRPQLPEGQIPVWDYKNKTFVIALVDLEDAHLSRFAWTLRKGYAQRTISNDGRSNSVLMHRTILNLSPSDETEGDHINLNRLDNRRSNLRKVTSAQNMQNQPSHRRWNIQQIDSGLRGVTWHKDAKKWRAQVIINGKYHWLGFFTDKHAAFEAASKFRRENMPFAVEA